MISTTLRKAALLVLAALACHGLLAEQTQPSTTIPSDSNFLAKPEYQSIWEDYSTLQKGKNFELVFIGDSITQQWRWGQGRKVWNKYFVNRALNFGQGADKTQNVLWRLKNLQVSSYKPRIAIILIGTNNIDDTPQDIAAGVAAVIENTRTTFSNPKIVLLSILPNKRATEKMAATNEHLKKLADGKSVVYLDLASKFTPEGDSWKGLQKDKLHLTEFGYEMWAAELLPVLDRL